MSSSNFSVASCFWEATHQLVCLAYLAGSSFCHSHACHQFLVKFLLLVPSIYLFLLRSITLHIQSDQSYSSLQRGHFLLGDVRSALLSLDIPHILYECYHLSEVSLITDVSQHSPLALHLSLHQWDAVSRQLPQCNPSISWPRLSGKYRPQSCQCSPVPGLRHHGQCANGSGPESLQVKENLTWKIALLVLSVFSVLYFFCVLQWLSPLPVHPPTNFLVKLSPFALLCSLATNDYLSCCFFNLSPCPAKSYFLQNGKSSFLSTELRLIITITWEYYRLNKLQIASCQWSNLLAKFTLKTELLQALKFVLKIAVLLKQKHDMRAVT